MLDAKKNNKKRIYLNRIREVYPDLEVSTVELVEESVFNDVLIVNDALIFRFPRSPDGVQRLKTEIAILDAVQGHMSFPVPLPTFVSDDLESVGEAFMGYQMLLGERLKDHLDAFCENTMSQKLADQLATFLRELHSLPPGKIHSELPLKDGSRREALPGLLREFREHLYPHMRADAQDLVTRQFEAFLNVSADFYHEHVLIHGDLGPGNILIDPNTQAISGVMDFGSAGLDDPAVDLGHVSFWGESFLGSIFVERLYEGYPMTEPLLSRVRFYKVMIALVVALEGLQGGDQETVEFALAQYV